MKRYRRLRRLVPDAELFRRRAAGETLRAIAADYGVSHTALSRFFARPQSVAEVRRAGELIRAEQRAAQLELRAKERAERAARRQAAQRQAAQARAVAERERKSPSRGAPRMPGRRAGGRTARPHASDPYLDWLDRPKSGNLGEGLVRLEAVDGTSKQWVEPWQVDELVSSGKYRRV